MNKDMILLRTVEVAAIAAYKFIGKKDKNLVDQAAVEAMNLMLENEKDFKLKVINGEGELDHAPMLYVGQILGDVTNNDSPVFDMSVDPVEGTAPAAKNYAGSITTIAISKENTMAKLPEMYMEKLFISQELISLNFFSDSLIDNVINWQKMLNRKDLKCIILDKPRHEEIIRQLYELGVIVRTIQDGDVLAAIDVVNGDADFVYGIGGAPEGILMSSLAIAAGAKMKWSLIPYAKIWPNETETKERTKIEQVELAKTKFSFGNYYEDFDLVADLRTRFFAAGLTAGGSLKPVVYNRGIYYVNAFMASHGVIRNIFSQYNKENISNLKPAIKYLLEKYER
ncbi:fructose-bisphosphatase class II [Spiroplasma endosymbiont of Labia minor]|uniref:fructose-bisphosphatase class II n=1 Tax=Spiroplasma endosymbiont of Labia minor TaxID=3066305 RepID=UPI0030CA7650